MNTHRYIGQRIFARRLLGIVALAALVVISTHVAAQTSQPGAVSLSPTPPDLKSNVDPNIVVTFDDSGSMAWTHMGDDAPYLLGGSWSGPWRCAGVIDPRVDPDATGLSAQDQARTLTMNGVYYNPNISYDPPLNKDGSSFPNADVSLAGVWLDGIAVNRPSGSVSAGSVGLNNNPDTPANTSASGRTNIVATTSSQRWKCGTGSTSDSSFGDASPMDGSTTNPGGTPAKYPQGGPYYYRFKSGINFLNSNGTLNTSTSGNGLYNKNNWEAIAVPATDYQNFANWYAYYRSRSLMARTSISRVFGNLGSNLRVAWQNLNAASYQLAAATIITSLTDTNTTGNSAANNYRTNFFNWIYAVPASGGTPGRSATIRAGEFFKRSGSSITNPYWQPGIGTAAGRELSCRQNYHMFVTDGFWNSVSGGESISSPSTYTTRTSSTLPDGAAYNPSDATSRIYTGPAEKSGGPTLADIAFYYWKTDLRSNLTDNVTPYFPDTTTGITGSTPLATGADPASNKEIYFNPVNDPATWQHVAQFMVSLGAAGVLQYSDDIDCVDPSTDLCKLRLGQTNSSGAIGWPQPDGTSSSTTTACPVSVPSGQGCARNIDDTWHAALAARGSFFNANNPSSLVQYLTDILNQIIARRSTSTALAVSLPVLTVGTQGYRGGYDSSDWAGYLTKVQLNADASVGSTYWDASCLLTGGACASTGVANVPVRNPNTRVIFTSDGTPNTGKPFRWTNLSTTQKAKMNRTPNSAVVSSSWVTDAYGSTRVDYLRGVRTNEVGGSTPVLRKRSSVLGAVINAQPLYVSSPAGGFTDNFPSGSPEAVAAASGNTYAQYQYNNRNRTPIVYTAANDGMLHAFDAITGSERWAYVPNMLFSNDKLSKLTGTDYGLVSTVDDRPLVQDVFLNGSWRTILVGSMRFGARGIYALDVTNPAGITESGATAIPLWEFTNTSTGGANLGYTFNSVNIARLNTGKWVVLLASGYFPQYITGCIPSDCDLSAVTTTPGSASANQTSLFVIDLQTGALIKEMLTSSAPQPSVTTYALSQPIVYDFASDQIDDIAVAGDLAGNLWRFDLSNTNSASWKVDRIFSNYGNGGTAAVGNQPISVTPVPLTDPLTRGPIYIFGTGKFLGDIDRVSSIPIQSFYGIRDYGTGSSNYPITVNQLVTLALSETASGVRSIASASSINVDASKRGWTFPLNLAQEPGERNVVKATPLYTSNRAILTTLIPTGDDPCSPLRRGAIMVVDGGTGGAPPGNPPVADTTGVPAGKTVIGKVLNSASIPAVGSIPLLTTPGGGVGTLPGISDLNIALPLWNRSAWRELLDRL